MANEPQRAAIADAPPQSHSHDVDQREAWFIGTPDPWKEIIAMEHGADRSFATVIERIVLSAEPAQQSNLEKKLLAVLARPELRPAGRLFVCRMLALIGSAASVPVVTPWLAQNETADLARLALDGIVGDGVNAAYREALPRLSGPAKAGLIGSIALRGDRASVDALQSIERDTRETAEVRAAATRALGRLTSNA